MGPKTKATETHVNQRKSSERTDANQQKTSEQGVKVRKAKAEKVKPTTKRRITAKRASHITPKTERCQLCKMLHPSNATCPGGQYSNESEDTNAEIDANEVEMEIDVLRVTPEKEDHISRYIRIRKKRNLEKQLNGLCDKKDASELADSTPLTADDAPQAANEAPQAADDAAQTTEDAPLIADDAPLTEDHTPLASADEKSIASGSDVRKWAFDSVSNINEYTKLLPLPHNLGQTAPTFGYEPPLHDYRREQRLYEYPPLNRPVHSYPPLQQTLHNFPHFQPPHTYGGIFPPPSVYDAYYPTPHLYPRMYQPGFQPLTDPSPGFHLSHRSYHGFQQALHTTHRHDEPRKQMQQHHSDSKQKEDDSKFRVNTLEDVFKFYERLRKLILKGNSRHQSLKKCGKDLGSLQRIEQIVQLSKTRPHTFQEIRETWEREGGRKSLSKLNCLCLQKISKAKVEELKATGELF